MGDGGTSVPSNQIRVRPSMAGVCDCYRAKSWAGGEFCSKLRKVSVLFSSCAFHASGIYFFVLPKKTAGETWKRRLSRAM